MKGSREANAEELLGRVLERLKVVRGPDERGEHVAWCVFHPDGEGKPPHQPNLCVSVRGYYCHACKAKGGLGKLAEKLGVYTERGKTMDIEKTYDYQDEIGNLLYQVVRLKGKDFRQRRPNGNGGWIWKRDGVRRVLYRLPELLARPNETVFIVEGEKDVDTLQAAGLSATTNPCGAGKWRKEYNGILKDRDVVILPDNDEPGRKHGEDVARHLHAVAKSVKLINLPGLPDKGDVSDWLAQGHTVEELRLLAENAKPWEAESKEALPAGDGDAKDADGNDGANEPLAHQLIGRVKASDAELFHDERKKPYCAMTIGGKRRVLPIDSSEFAEWLSRTAWQEMNVVPRRDLLSAVCGVLSSEARFDGAERPLEIRCARHEGAVWIDLDGSRAIRVAPGEWSIVEEPPILFRSIPSQRPIPTPVSGGDLGELRRFVNVGSDDDAFMLACYCIAALIPEIPMPALVIHGPQGSAKTTLLKVVKSLVDPSAVSVRGSVASAEEFCLACWQNRVLFFDNLTHLPNWLSDALCRAVSGEGWSKRKLYSDEDATVFEYRRVVGIAAINLVAERPDLLDRSVILELEPISNATRRDEESFWQEFDRARPGIFGGMLDVLAKAMTIKQGLQCDSLPRMADFARWGMAIAEAIGWGQEGFRRAYGCNVARQNHAAVEASPVAQAVIALMEDRAEWTGTPGDLLGELGDLAAVDHIDTRTHSWPKCPSWLSRRLHEIVPCLLAGGIELTFDDRTARRRRIRVRKRGGDAVTAVTAVTGVT
jgi:hypothetical protein